MSSCRFFNNIFSCAAPVWADQKTLTALQSAIDSDAKITDDAKYADPDTGADEAMDAALMQLQFDGMNAHDFRDLIDRAQEAAVANPPQLPDNIRDLFSFRNLGNPSYLKIDIMLIVEILRFISRFKEQHTSNKHVLQLGVLTMTVQGKSNSYNAQTFPAEVGVATNTVWLYRWCTYAEDGTYEEQWRPFLRGLSQVGTAARHPARAMAMPKQLAPKEKSTGIVSSKRPLESDHSEAKLNGLQLPMNATMAEQPQAKRPRRDNRYRKFNHWALTDDQLFAGDPVMLQGDCIIRLAHGYSNQEIMNRINALHPRTIASVNVITKRLTHAIDYASEATGKTAIQIRQEIAEAKAANGVNHKAKIDTSGYAVRGPRSHGASAE